MSVACITPSGECPCCNGDGRSVMHMVVDGLRFDRPIICVTCKGYGMILTQYRDAIILGIDIRKEVERRGVSFGQVLDERNRRL